MAVGPPLRAVLRSNCPSGELPPAVSLAPAILDTARTKRRTKRNTTDLSLRKIRILKKSPSRRNKSEDIARGIATESSVAGRNVTAGRADGELRYLPLESPKVF